MKINVNSFANYIRKFYYDDLNQVYFGSNAIKFINNNSKRIGPNSNLLNDELVFIFSRTKTKNISYPLHYNQFKTEYEHWIREKKLKRIINDL